MKLDILTVQQLLETQKQKRLVTHPQLAGYFVDVSVAKGRVKLPFLPIGAFREFDFTKDVTNLKRVFRSSGSTQTTRAQHGFGEQALTLAERWSAEGFRMALERFHIDCTLILSLVPPTEVWRDSSLAHMIESFSKNGFEVVFVDAQNVHAHIMMQMKRRDTALVFGTTFHHLEVSLQKNRFECPVGKDLFVFDTGGTKGKSQHLGLQEASEMLRNTYGAKVKVLSEYGMCELGSQAYSAQIPHDQNFICNETLAVVAVDVQKLKECESGETGFLAFVDLANDDSYSAILTEDLGTVRSGNDGFRLFGRAPDASLKGCSLNVRDTFYFKVAPMAEVATPLVKKQPFAARDVIKELENEPEWTIHALSDLNVALESLESMPPVSQNLHLKKVACVSSANIPITWLYPAFAAQNMGAASFSVELPSLRLEDPISLQVRAQSRSLMTAIAKRLSMSLNEGQTPDPDVLLVFGNDATIELYQKQFGHQTKVVGLGDVHNSISAKALMAALPPLTQWWGRGCLTPLVVFVPDTVNGKDVEAFSNMFDEEFSKRFSEARINPAHYHAHHRLLLNGRAKMTHGMRLHLGLSTVVIDLTEHDFAPNTMVVDPTTAGCGVVYLLRENDKSRSGVTFSEFESNPDFLAKHCGKTWLEWLST